MMIDIYNFFADAAAKYRSEGKTPLKNYLDYIYALVSYTSISEVMVTDSGQVSYKPPGFTNARVSSLTRFVNYAKDRLPVWYMVTDDIKQTSMQPIQDYIIQWALESFKNDKYTFVEVTGADIIEAYRTGPSSCMRGKKAQLALYENNPERISLLKVYEGENYVARALVWTTNDGKRVLDRIYPGNGTLAFSIRQYAESQGWAYKEHDSVGSQFKGDGEFTITLKHPGNGRMPYLDSFGRVYGLSDDSITLTNKYRTVDGASLPQTGSYTGRSNAYSSYQYLDGTLVVRKLVEHGTGYFFENPTMHLQTIQTTPTRAKQYALRPTDVLYHINSESYPILPKKIVEINGRFYKRIDVTKVRNQDAYRPKRNAQAYALESTHTYGNGAVKHILTKAVQA